MNLESTEKKLKISEMLNYVKKQLEIRLAYVERNGIKQWEKRIEKIREGIRAVLNWRELHNGGIVDSDSIIENVQRLIDRLLKP